MVFLNNNKSNDIFRKSVLDLGFGDGRNIPFLTNLGLKVFGLEISEKIVNKCKLFLENNGFYPTLSVGTNEQTFLKLIHLILFWVVIQFIIFQKENI